MKVDTDGLCGVDKQTHRPTHPKHTKIKILSTDSFNFKSHSNKVANPFQKCGKVFENMIFCGGGCIRGKDRFMFCAANNTRHNPLKSMEDYRRF